MLTFDVTCHYLLLSPSRSNNVLSKHLIKLGYESRSDGIYLFVLSFISVLFPRVLFDIRRTYMENIIAN